MGRWVIRSPGPIGRRFVSWPLFIGVPGIRNTITVADRVFKAAPGADDVFSPVDTENAQPYVTFPIKILKRDKRLVNRCTVKRMENFRFGPTFGSSDYLAALSFLSLSLFVARNNILNQDEGFDGWRYLEIL